MRDHIETLIELLSITDVLDAVRGKPVAVVDSLQVSIIPELHRNVVAALVDAFRLEDVGVAARGHAVTITEELQAQLTLITNYGVVVSDRLRVAAQMLGTTISGEAVVEALRVIDLLQLAQDAAVSDSVLIADLTATQRAVGIIESLSVVVAAQGAAVLHLSIEQSIRLVDGLTNFFGGEISEGLVLADAIRAQGRLPATAVETVAVSDVVEPRLLVAVTATEELQLNDENVLQMLFQPTVVEGLEITLGYLAPSGSTTAWVMNTRTGAVTEYQNYEFNSFASLGNKYIAASKDGLFELVGDTDSGNAIIASLKSGFMQFGGTRLSRLGAAYIAARGEGNFILRIVDGDGKTYDYTTSTRNMRSTKVHMGKGQRSRYFSFELISAGQDFDLDTLEFVPVLVQRRV